MNHDAAREYSVVKLESTDARADGVEVNPTRTRWGRTWLTDPLASSEEPTEPYLSARSRSALPPLDDEEDYGVAGERPTSTEVQTVYKTTEEDPLIRWPLPSSLLVTS